MAFDKNKQITFKVKLDGVNECIDSKGSMAVMLREVAWNNKEKYVLELRKWETKINDKGEAETKPLKGVTFLTEQGPHTLTEKLVEHGYGDTKRLLAYLKERNDN